MHFPTTHVHVHMCACMFVVGITCVSLFNHTVHTTVDSVLITSACVWLYTFTFPVVSQSTCLPHLIYPIIEGQGFNTQHKHWFPGSVWVSEVSVWVRWGVRQEWGEAFSMFSPAIVWQDGSERLCHLLLCYLFQTKVHACIFWCEASAWCSMKADVAI